MDVAKCILLLRDSSGRWVPPSEVQQLRKFTTCKGIKYVYIHIVTFLILGGVFADEHSLGM